MAHHKIQKSKRSSILSKRTSREFDVTSIPEDPVDRLLVTDPVLIRIGHEIRRHQRLLKEACSDDAWRIYLRIEELINERMFSFADKWVAKHPAPTVHHGQLMRLR